MWLAALLTPALIVFAVHLLLLSLLQKVTIWRVRGHVSDALLRGDSQSLRRAAAETAEAEKDWPSRDLWVLGKAVEIARRRAEHAV